MSEFTGKINEAIALLESDINEGPVFESLSFILNNEEGCKEFFKYGCHKKYLIDSAKKGYLVTMQAIWGKMRPDASSDEFNPEDNYQSTPLHYAAKNGHLVIVQAIWDKMGPYASNIEISPKDDVLETPLHYAVKNGHLAVVQAIFDKMGPNTNIKKINPKNMVGATPLHYASLFGYSSVIQEIWKKMGPYASSDEISPKDYNQDTPLHNAAYNGHLVIVQAILDKMGPYAGSDEINHKNDKQRTPLYEACGQQKFDVVHALLDNEFIEVNHVGPGSLLTFFSADTPDCNRVRERLRQLGCLEIPEVNRAPNARLVQDIQGIHASEVEKSIKRSLEKLRVGKDAFAVTSSYEDFIQYCNLSNPAFVEDLRAIEVNSQNFSRNLIVKALSVTDAVSEQEKVELEKSKVSLFNDAIAHRLRNMTLSSNSADFVKSFKERLGLIWGELSNPECWHKFTDLKEIMDKEGEEFSKDNSSAEFKLALQKLRNVLFVQLIETRYEYASGLNIGANANIPSRADYLDALERSRPSCAGGTNNFIIECFSHRHQDIEVLAGQFTPDFTPDATLPIRIASKLYELILASANTLTEIQTRVDSETKIQSIEGISIVNELLDRMAGASDKVKKVLPEDTILLEGRIREYFRTGTIPGHSRAIGLLLGLLKQTLQENQEIIGGLHLQPNEDQEEALTEAFRHLEQALANSQPGFLIQALTEARSQYYQSFFKENLDEQKLNRFIKMLKGNEGVDIDERELIRAALIESYGEAKNNDVTDKIITANIIRLIKETSWYKAVVNHMVGESQVQAQNMANMLCPSDDLTKKLDEMLGLKLSVDVLENEEAFNAAVMKSEDASTSVILFSGNIANSKTSVSLEGEPKDLQRKDSALKGNNGP